MYNIIGGIFMLKLKMRPMPTSDWSGRVKQIPGRWTHSGARQNCDILVVMLSGECDFDFTEIEKVVHLRKNEATIIRTGNFYKGSCDNDCEYYFFHIPTFAKQVTKAEMTESIARANQIMETNERNYYIHAQTVYDCLFMSEIVDVTAIIKQLNNLFAKCDIELSKRDVNRKLRFDICLCEILALISEESMRQITKSPSYPAALGRILTYINENYTEPITLESLSEHFGLSKQYLIRLFHAHLGTTVTRYVNDLKLSHAPELLSGTTLNVSEVAEHLGFSSAGYFARLFRAKYSVSPTKFV